MYVSNNIKINIVFTYNTSISEHTNGMNNNKTGSEYISYHKTCSKFSNDITHLAYLNGKRNYRL